MMSFNPTLAEIIAYDHRAAVERWLQHEQLLNQLREQRPSHGANLWARLLTAVSRSGARTGTALPAGR
jgi:hypothetical protein